jgi:hypothetical protein
MPSIPARRGSSAICLETRAKGGGPSSGKSHHGVTYRPHCTCAFVITKAVSKKDTEMSEKSNCTRWQYIMQSQSQVGSAIISVRLQPFEDPTGISHVDVAYIDSNHDTTERCMTRVCDLPCNKIRTNNLQTDKIWVLIVEQRLGVDCGATSAHVCTVHVAADLSGQSLLESTKSSVCHQFHKTTEYRTMSKVGPAT